MLKHFGKLFIILIYTCLLGQLYSQTPQPQISIRATSLFQHAQVLYFSNIDIFNVGNAQYLFDIIVEDIEPGNANDETAYLELILTLDGSPIPIATARSDEFFVRLVDGRRFQATNIELIQFNQLGNFINLNFNTTFDPPDSKFEDEFYGSGRARRGYYRLQAKLNIIGHQNSPFIGEISVLVKNPSNIQLSSPGNKIGSGLPQEIMTDLPVFAFFSDGTEFIVSVYEKLSHHQSIEDVINSGNAMFVSDPISTPVFNYAAVNGQPLQVGHTYYWFVDVLVPTTAGTEKFRSEVFQFKVVQSTGAQSEGIAVASVIEMLRPIVGNQVDEISKTLSNFELKNIRLNGKPITIYELYQIIDGYEGHLIEISGFNIQ